MKIFKLLFLFITCIILLCACGKKNINIDSAEDDETNTENVTETNKLSISDIDFNEIYKLSVCGNEENKTKEVEITDEEYIDRFKNIFAKLSDVDENDEDLKIHLETKKIGFSLLNAYLEDGTKITLKYSADTFIQVKINDDNYFYCKSDLKNLKDFTDLASEIYVNNTSSDEIE